ncbi:MAG: hypothetical protein IPQ09_13135 [Myxococcales bacterium]|nr:hypothetical protein [Myxococcales bacterium]HQY61828.1 hypothetical protein [Polyangiaceae bacterium]
MIRAHLVRVTVVLGLVLVAAAGCSSSSSSEDAGTANDCEAAFNALCDKGAACSPSGEVVFGSAATGDGGARDGGAGGGGTITIGSASSCKTVYSLGCTSSPPANVAACKAASATAQCSTPAGEKPRLVFPKECETPQK